MYKFFKDEFYRKYYNDVISIYEIEIETTNFETGPYISDIWFYSPKFDKKFTLFEIRVDKIYHLCLAEVRESYKTSKWINCVEGRMSDFTKRITDEPVDHNYSCEKIDPNKFMSVLLDLDLAPEYLIQSCTLAYKASIDASNTCMHFANGLLSMVDIRLRHLINKNYELETQLKKPDVDTCAIKKKQSEILKKITDLNNSLMTVAEATTKFMADMYKVYDDVNDAYHNSYKR